MVVCSLTHQLGLNYFFFKKTHYNHVSDFQSKKGVQYSYIQIQFDSENYFGCKYAVYISMQTSFE